MKPGLPVYCVARYPVGILKIQDTMPLVIAARDAAHTMAYTVVMETALILFLLLAIWLVLGAASKGLAQLADALDEIFKKE